MSSSVCRWGILGAAEIARKNWRAIWNSGNATLVGVASRSKSKAEEFIETCQAEIPFRQRPRAFGDYEQLLAEPDIDAVYIPLPTALRKDWVIRAARAGKHVLAEKPAASDSAALEAMLTACEENGVQWMDGVMFYHSARLSQMAESLNDGVTVGPVRRLAAQFSFPAPEAFFRDNIRVHSELEPLGVLGDLGWYCIGFFLWAMDWTMPETVQGHLLAEGAPTGDASPVPIELSGELFYPDGVTAGFYCSFRTAHQQWAHVSGHNGNLSLPDFVLPYSGNELAYTTNRATYEINGCDFSMKNDLRRHKVTEASHGNHTAQEARMLHRFSQLVLHGKPDHTWTEKSRKVQRVVDASLKSARDGGKAIQIGG